LSFFFYMYTMFKTGKITKPLLCILFLLVSFSIKAQIGSATKLLGQGFNPIQTVVPFLTISPDSRAGGMGDAGVATDPDPASEHWNPSKYVFMKDKLGATISFIPWLRNLVPDINLAYLSGFYKVDKTQAISGSLRYFSLGNMIFTNEYNQPQGQFNPNEFAIDGGYSRLFTDHLSGAMTFYMVRSDFGRAFVSSVGETKPGYSFGANISWYYNNMIQIGEKKAKIAFGMNISNIGSKLSYTNNSSKQFVPTNLRLGGMIKTYLDDYNAISVTMDANKLLVPTPPIMDTTGKNIMYGMSTDVPVFTGMVHSFYDAPGGFKEELQEINLCGGTEYSYRDQFFVRGGFFYENKYKGNRKYYTLGFGLRYNVLLLDFAYMVPVGGRNSPLANTMRISLGYLFGSTKSRR
jgi:hypothetical protein